MTTKWFGPSGDCGCCGGCIEIPGLHLAISGFGTFNYTGSEYTSFTVDLSSLNQDSVAPYGTNANGFVGWNHNPPFYSSATDIDSGVIVGMATWIIITDSTIKACVGVRANDSSIIRDFFREYTLPLARCATLSESSTMGSTSWTILDEPTSPSAGSFAEAAEAEFDAATIVVELDL